ncbi:MAG: EamA family transporter [Clostridia bacterium]|nr:EamA family transporter [Clostridia bacterium]
MVYILILVNVILLVTGQVLWKYGLDKLGGINAGNWLQVVTSWPILAGMVLYVLATGVWFVILSRANLSVAYPMQSIAYVLGMVAGFVFFKEAIPLNGWLGGLLVIMGVSLIAVR